MTDGQRTSQSRRGRVPAKTPPPPDLEQTDTLLLTEELGPEDEVEGTLPDGGLTAQAWFDFAPGDLHGPADPNQPDSQDPYDGNDGDDGTSSPAPPPKPRR
jgi:hypothetical protein